MQFGKIRFWAWTVECFLLNCGKHIRNMILNQKNINIIYKNINIIYKLPPVSESSTNISISRSLHGIFRPSPINVKVTWEMNNKINL
jgi:hypothetical protein